MSINVMVYSDEQPEGDFFSLMGHRGYYEVWQPLAETLNLTRLAQLDILEVTDAARPELLNEFDLMCNWLADHDDDNPYYSGLREAATRVADIIRQYQGTNLRFSFG